MPAQESGVRLPPVVEPRFPVWFRVWLTSIALGLISMLITAALISPDPSGTGTHRQILGLPPCGFLLVFGQRCPSCGMTTAWSHFVRGQWWASIHANAGGFLLALAAPFVAVWLLSTAWLGRWWPAEPQPIWLLVGFTLIVGTTAVQWCWL